MSDITVLTGGTGWVGRNFLSEIQRNYSPAEIQERVLIFGSKEGEIIINKYRSKEFVKIPVYPLSSLNNMLKKKPEIRLIHSAFLRKEKLNKLGIKRYIKENKEITNCVRDLLRSSSNSKSIVISSGAATLFEKDKKSIEEDPYGFLKLNEENKLNEVSECMKLRIYGLTGQFITNPELFALGSFLISAKEKKPIEIKSKFQVIRSYGFASDISKFGLRWLNSNLVADSIFAATETLSIYELAQKITTLYNLQPVKANIDYDLQKDEYTCDTTKFKKYLNSFNIKPTNLAKQITETFKYI